MTQAMDVDGFLVHYGVKGMRWGVRKNYNELRNAPRENIKLTTEKGKQVTLKETGNSAIASAIGAAFPKFGKLIRESRGFDIEVDGKNVGSTAFREKSKDELNLVWVGVNKKHRGQGYASTVFDAGVEYARSKGYKEITLEVPGNAPDARHIYEKRGFKVAGPMEGDKNDIWGGLTPMSLDISNSEVRHAAEDVTEAEMELALTQHMTALQIDNIVFPTEEEGTKMAHAMETEDFLAHYGVKGMRWGVRKSRTEKDKTWKERRRENSAERAKTRIAVRDTYAKGIDKSDAGIKRSRQALPEVERQFNNSRDQYKIDKQVMNKIAARRQMQVAAAELDRIRTSAETLTKDEQFAADMMGAGRAVVDVLSRPENRRSLLQKIADEQEDKRRIREAYTP